jgi:BirA family biotin operon repressor/biotin-[acetyl-CoA-carboxylase] ligase
MTKSKKIHYLHFDTLDSTNTWAKKNAETLDPDHLTCITALEQTAGRGRFNRKWISGRGQNVIATLFFTLPQEARILANLGQVLSLSCAAVLEKKGFSPKIKWPNDLLLSGKKVAGILCETASFKERLAIILGIGINVNLPEELLATIDQPATSLAQQSGKTWDLNQILEPLVTQFTIDLERLEKEGFAPFQAAYQTRLALHGETITCSNGSQKIRGICQSIDHEGRLILLLPDGQVAALTAGELIT